MTLTTPIRPCHVRRRMRRWLWMGRTTRISDHDLGNRHCDHHHHQRRLDDPTTIRSRCHLMERILVGVLWLLLVSLFHEPPRILGFTTTTTSISTTTSTTTTTTSANATAKITKRTNVPLFAPSLPRRPSSLHQPLLQRHNYYHRFGYLHGVRSLRSLSTSDDDDQSTGESWSLLLLLSPEDRYVQRLQRQIDVLRQKDRSSRPIAVSVRWHSLYYMVAIDDVFQIYGFPVDTSHTHTLNLVFWLLCFVLGNVNIFRIYKSYTKIKTLLWWINQPVYCVYPVKRESLPLWKLYLRTYNNNNIIINNK